MRTIAPTPQIDRLAKEGTRFTRYYAACAYALKGQKDVALASLERAIRMRPDYTKARARVEPELESLRAEPAFRQMIA